MKKYLILVWAIAMSSLTYARTSDAPVEEVLENSKRLKSLEKSEVRDVKGTIINAGDESEKEPADWFTLSPGKAEGVSADRVYQIYGDYPRKEIIVAVIDSGVDVNHEDLQGKIWINEDEIPNNGIDDDFNGYVDDVFGWNFIGGKKGMGSVVKNHSLANKMQFVKGKAKYQIESDTLEVTRIAKKLLDKKWELSRQGKSLNRGETFLLNKTLGEVSVARKDAKESLALYIPLLKAYKKSLRVLEKNGIKIDFDKSFEELTEEVKKFKPQNFKEYGAKAVVLDQLAQKRTIAKIEGAVEANETTLKYYYNLKYNPRGIVGDDYEANQVERDYGNNDIIGPDSHHGTHVAGIIAANRDNKIGIKGIADKVKIMAVRCVPDGDERDKDVANAIRYAVDNGAKIINMSFGKSYSPYKRVVDLAVQYAESKGVLMIHAAGNSNQNNDVEDNFPNRYYLDYFHEVPMPKSFNNWLEIGASSYKADEHFNASFSNYGKNSVQVFAPGYKLKSTTPDNTYATYSGTSMASPSAAGAAALVWSLMPDISLQELKTALLASAKFYPLLDVLVPGYAYQKHPEGYEPQPEDYILFSELSSTGGVIDAFYTLQFLNL
ncbi:MAG: S8 family serine peptidase [Halobacteriovoraceae bacterium]|nr:S8 family serine peptidase [Halobacteriovoraceae bacterium]MCB9095136.1 S8 family serine peptidase [Halobacteriovoraceae bacterium]